MSRLRLYLLGPPHLELDGKAVHLPRRKALALPRPLSRVRPPGPDAPLRPVRAQPSRWLGGWAFGQAVGDPASPVGV
jgi:hypothetical protein